MAIARRTNWKFRLFNWTKCKLGLPDSLHNARLKTFNPPKIAHHGKGAFLYATHTTMKNLSIAILAGTILLSSCVPQRKFAEMETKKNTCEKDKRLVDITLSPKGLDLVDQLDQYNERIDALLKGINESEAQMMNQILDKIRIDPTSA